MYKSNNNNNNDDSVFESNLSMRELYRMGAFDLVAEKDKPSATTSGRKVTKPKRFTNETFVKGSGCCSRSGRDNTDMQYV